MFEGATSRVENPLVTQIDVLKNQIIDAKRLDLLDTIATFDRQLKQNVRDRFGSTQLLQQVDVWQKLVGGSIEAKRDITDAQYEFVVGEVMQFVDALEAKLHADT